MTPSKRNKTIILTESEEKLYSSRSLIPDSPRSVDDITDKTVLGDLFTVSKLLPDNFVDLIIADPPYNLYKKFGSTSFSKIPLDEYRIYTEKWIDAVYHTLKKNASVYVCCDWYSSIVVGEVLQKRFNLLNRITWQREKGRGSKTNWKSASEDIWFASCGKEYTFNPDAVKLRRRVLAPYKSDGVPKDWQENDDGTKFRDTYASNFWDDISVPFWSMSENTEHPTQKPEKLTAKLILASSNENDFVFDPFMGSGTVPVTAKKLNRRFCGIEKEPKYCAISEKRLEQALTDQRIQGYENKIFHERNSCQNTHRKEKNK